MSKKTYSLVIGITGAVCAAASAIVAFFDPAYTAAIVASIGVANTAVDEICTLFLQK
jgi:hypothetical protein